MEANDIYLRKKTLTSWAKEVEVVLKKISIQNNQGKKENAKNGRMDFAYAEYYLAEIVSLLNLSIYLLGHDSSRKYTYFPARQIMEITLQLEHVYSIKAKKGSKGVQRMFFKDMTKSAKSAVAWPGEKGKNTLIRHLTVLDIASKILKLDFKTDDVSAKSNRDINSLCKKSKILLKNCTGGELYNYYEVLSEASHSNVVTIGASNHGENFFEASIFFEISVELSIRFCEMIIKECGYGQLETDLEYLKKITGI